MAMERAGLDFRVVIDAACPMSAAQRESAAVAGVLAQTLVEATVGFASAMLEQAAADDTITYSGTATGSMYAKVNKQAVAEPNCIRFWYGRTGRLPLSSTSAISMPDGVTFKKDEDRLLDAWVRLGLQNVPDLYGEFETVFNSGGTAVYLRPVAFYYSPIQRSFSWFSSAPSLTIGIDILGVGSNAVSTALMTFGNEGHEPTLLLQDALRGKTTAWMAIPPRPEKNEDYSDYMGDFTAKITITQTQKGSAFAKALSDAVKSKKTDISTALTAELPSGRAATANAARTALDAATVGVFDAEIEVTRAQAALTANSDTSKTSELELALTLAKFKVDVRRRAAGLPSKYNVAP